MHVLYKCMKFHQNVLYGYQSVERRQFCDGQKDGQGKTIWHPTLKGGGGGGGGDIKRLLDTNVLNYCMHESLTLIAVRQ